MRVRLKTTMAGPGGTHTAGTVVSLPPAEAKMLIAGGYAEIVGVQTTPKRETAVAPPPTTYAKDETLTQINGVGEELAAVLVQRGWSTIESVASADIAELIKVPGIGKKSAVQIVANAKKVVGE